MSKSKEMFVKVEEWKKSGQSLSKFALSIGISKGSLTYWVLKKRRLESNSPAFVELSPLVKPNVSIEVTSKHPDTDSQAQIVFTFPSGMCIKVYG